MLYDIFNKDYLTIKEFSELVGISKASLRHYDKVGLFKPAKRGREFNNDYRYYSPMQLKTINIIRVLTEIGVPVETIKALTQNRSPEKMLKVFRKYKYKLSKELNYLQEACSIVEIFTELLYEAISVDESEISIIEMPERKIILGNINDYSLTDGFIREFARFCYEDYNPKLNLSYPIGSYFNDMSEYMKEPTKPKRFFSINPKGNEKIENGLYLVGYTYGDYNHIHDLPERLTEYANKNGYIFSGPVYNIYLTDVVSALNSEDYLLQVSVPVLETSRTPSRNPHHHYENLKG